ncbi:MAG: ABC transporter permease, partial [Nocardioides sp.]
MTQLATLQDPFEEVAPPRGRSGAAAWAIWLSRRIGLAVLSLWLVSVLVFLATAALGDPVRAILGRDYDSNVGRREQLEAQLGVGDSLVSRYFDWLGGRFTGDFGTSLANQQSVWQQISSNVVNTLVLVFLAAIVMIPLAFGIAMISAHYRRRRPDTVIQTILLALAGIPDFVIGILLVALFSTTVFHIFPAVTIATPTGHPWDTPKGMVLPVATLVLAVTPYVSRIVRATLLEVLDSDYVELARLKGIPEPVVMRK